MHHKIISIIFASTLFLIMFTSIISLVHSIEWSPEMRLTWRADIDAFPSITQTSDGLIWVVWRSDRTGNAEIFYKIYNESSVHPWSPETQLTDDTNLDLAPSITQTLDGTIWVVWSSNRTGNYDVYYKTYNGTWSSDKPLTTDLGKDQDPSILQATNGTIWVVWSSKPLGEFDFNIYYATSSDNGETWSIQILPTTSLSANDLYPSITETIDGSIWVVWVKEGDIFYSIYNGDPPWSPATQLTTDPNFDTRPSIAQALDGTVWVVWDSDRNPNDGDVYYKTYDGTWSGDTLLITYSSMDFAPAILHAVDGTVWVSWSSTREDNIDVYYITNSIPDENDVAIFTVLPSPTIVTQGKNVSIEVVSQNKGTKKQTFQVSCYVDTIPLESITVPLDPGQLNATTFQWNTTSAQLGTHTITAEASIVAGETKIDDNTYVYGTVTVVTHDVAVKDITLSQTLVHRGYTTVYIDVQVANEGNFTETFSVTAYYDSTAIRTMTIVNVTPNSNITLTFPWSAGVPYGPYIISAKASPVQDELDLADNSFTDGTVNVTIAGDFNYDRIVNILDSAAVSAHWYPGPPVGPSGYDPNIDINQDGEIDIFDAAIVSSNWLESW